MADTPDFIKSLTDWIGTTAVLERTTAPFALFAHAAEESQPPAAKNYTDPYTVIRGFGGDPAGSDPTCDRSLQSYTVGNNVAACMAQAQKVHDALLMQRSPDDDGNTPARNVAITGWFILAIGNLRQPGLIGRDPKQRAEVVFNFEVVYRAA